MSKDQDHRIVELLRACAPPARDPVFRIKALERREERRFQRQSLIMLAGALVIVLASAFVIRIGGGALRTTGWLFVGAALASAYLAFRGRLVQIFRRFSI